MRIGEPTARPETTMQTTLNVTSVCDVIDYINDHAKSAVERGSRRERAVVFYLRHDPEMRQIMGDVRLWADAPTNDGHDTGIDVACEYNGSASDDAMRYWAVQCKNYDPSHKMDYKELSTFWAKAEADNRYAGSRYPPASTRLSTRVTGQQNGRRSNDT